MRRVLKRRSHRYRSVGGYARNRQRHYCAAFRPRAYQLIGFQLVPPEALASGNHNTFRRAEHRSGERLRSVKQIDTLTHGIRIPSGRLRIGKRHRQLMSFTFGSRGFRIFYGNRQRLLYRVTVCVIGYVGKRIAGSAIRHARLIARVRVAAVGIQTQRAVRAVGTARQLYRRNVAFAIHAPAVSSGFIVFQNIAAYALSLFSKPVHVIRGHRHVVMHGHIDGAGSCSARSVRHRNRECVFQTHIRLGTISAMLLTAAQLIVVAYLPLIPFKRGMHVGKRNPKHWLGTAAGRSHSVFNGNGEAADSNRTVLAMQVDQERTTAALSMMSFTTVFGLRAFVHHDRVVADTGLLNSRIEVLLHRNVHGRAVAVPVRRRDRERLAAKRLIRIRGHIFVVVIATAVISNDQTAASDIERRLVSVLRRGRAADAQGILRSAVRSEVYRKAAGKRAVRRIVGRISRFTHRFLRHHRSVVMHFHHQRAGSHIAGGIRHRNIDAVRKSVICADGTSTPHIIVSLLLGQLICVFNLPRTAGRLLRGSRHRYLDAVHRQCCVGGKPCLVERIAVDQAQGNGRVLPSAVLQRNGAVFAVQIHGKRVLTGNAVHYMLTGTIGKRAFIHHDLGFVFSRRHRLLLIAPDGDGQRRFRRIAVRIHDGVGEGFRNARVLLYIHVLVQLVGIGTVRVQRQLAVGAFQRATDLAFHAVMLDRGHRIGQVIRTGLVILQHIAHDPLLRLGFLPYDGIVNSRRRIIHHVHRDGRAAAVAVRIRHGHDQGMGDLRVRIGIALDVFRGVPVEPVAEVQLARGRVITRHRQGAFIRAHDLTGQRAVLEYHHAADDDGRHTVRSVDAQGASGHGGRILLPSLRTACQAGFIDRHHLRGRTDTGRRHGHTMIDFRVRAGLHRICGKLRAAIKTDVQAPQMVKAVQQVAAAVFVIAAAARGAAAGGRTGCGHQVFVKGGEEVLPADLHTVHLEGGHLFLGIGGIEPLQLDGSAILKGQDKIVAIAGQRRRVRGKIKDEAPVRSAGDGLRGTSGRLGKTDIGHEGPPETCMIFQKNL